jgi:hypothetical protein
VSKLVVPECFYRGHTLIDQFFSVDSRQKHAGMTKWFFVSAESPLAKVTNIVSLLIAGDTAGTEKVLDGNAFDLSIYEFHVQ